MVMLLNELNLKSHVLSRPEILQGLVSPQVYRGSARIGKGPTGAFQRTRKLKVFKMTKQFQLQVVI
jgi:hypothetical protein